MLKLKRRSFLGLLSAIPFAPLVAKDMGDFDFLPPEYPKEVSEIPQIPKSVTAVPNTVIYDGQIRYNTDTNQLEFYNTNQWHTLTNLELNSNA